MKGLNKMLGKFNSLFLAIEFSNKTTKMSVVMLGDDNKFWVVTLGKMNQLLKEGYELAD